MKRLILSIFAIVMVLAGCERRPLVNPTSTVGLNVQVNIKAVANVTTTVYNEHIPVPDLSTSSMRVMIYDPVTKNRLGESIISRKVVDENGNQSMTGNLDISYGEYDILIFNEFDSPNTKITGTANENTIVAYTDDITEEVRTRYGIGATRAGDDDEAETEETEFSFDDLEIREEPDHLVVAHEQHLYISPRDTMVVIHTVAHTIVESYYIQIHVTGMKFANTATAVISGLSPSNFFGQESVTVDHPVAVCFPLQKSIDENATDGNQDVLCATFNTFGKIPDASSTLYVTFNVIDTAGKLQQKKINLDDIFNTEDARERHWLLIDETWEIKDPGTVNPPTGNGGFQPQVDDWQEEEGSITL